MPRLYYNRSLGIIFHRKIPLIHKRSYMIFIDTILTILGTTIKKEYKRRIAIINIVIRVYGIEEGTPLRSRIT
ncbi:hypothetical protein N7475_007659 [Penicillium sp. IBT 31633x]|nr:hypothetical protein N7475_007659 [Penicillium sp. IBT 31633x]